MKRTFEGKITIKKGIIISDPWYEASVKCRYTNRRKMENYKVTIQTMPMEECEDYYTILMCILEDGVETNIEFAEDLFSFSIPKSFKVKHFDIGVDSAAVLIGANDNDFIEEIHTGGDGHLGDVFQISKPVVKNGKNKYEYCGIIFMGAFDATINPPDKLIGILKYNLTGLTSIT